MGCCCSTGTWKFKTNRKLTESHTPGIIKWNVHAFMLTWVVGDSGRGIECSFANCELKDWMGAGGAAFWTLEEAWFAAAASIWTDGSAGGRTSKFLLKDFFQILILWVIVLLGDCFADDLDHNILPPTLCLLATWNYWQQAIPTVQRRRQHDFPLRFQIHQPLFMF